MKVRYDWESFSLLQKLMALMPFKAKRYVMKWLRVRGDKYTSRIDIYQMPKCKIVTFDALVSKWTPSNAFIVSPIYASAASFKQLWESLLAGISKLENMRNVEELCIWLDMNDV